MAKIAGAPNKTAVKKGTEKGSQGSRNFNINQEIEALAYQFFVDRGYEHGHDREDWIRAEAIVKSRYHN